MTTLDDPHDVGKRLEPFRKNGKLEDYFVRLNEHLLHRCRSNGIPRH